MATRTQIGEGKTSEVFSGEEAWTRLLVDAQASRRRMAAVAYVTTAGLLGWLQDDILVVDASDQVLQSGSTSPKALSALLRKKVRVWSVAGLHAKIYAFDKVAWVGSFNQSHSSRHQLIEAGARLTTAAAVSAARETILSLTTAELGAKRVDRHFVERAREIYKPPLPSPRKAVTVPRRRTGVWAIGLQQMSDPAYARMEALAERADAAASKKRPDLKLLPDSDRYTRAFLHVGQPGSRANVLARRIRADDRILMIWGDHYATADKAEWYDCWRCHSTYREGKQMVLLMHRERRDAERDLNKHGVLARKLSKQRLRIGRWALRELKPGEVAKLERALAM